MDNFQFRAFLDLLMCSDPWPVSQLKPGGGRVLKNGKRVVDEGNHKTMTDLADEEAKQRGYDNWIVAFHEFKV